MLAYKITTRVSTTPRVKSSICLNKLKYDSTCICHVSVDGIFCARNARMNKPNAGNQADDGRHHLAARQR